MKEKQIPSSKLLNELQDIAGPLPTETAPTPNLSEAELAQVSGGAFVGETGWSHSSRLRVGGH